MNNRTDILNELENISPLLAAIGNKNVFSVPDGYFDSIGPTVLLSVKEDLVPSRLENATVPDGYFESLPGNILSRIKTQAEEPELEIPSFFSEIGKEQPFEIPDGYFNSLSTSILSVVKNEEDNLPSVFDAVSKSNSFEVPQDYFQSLSSEILSRIAVREKESMPAVFKDIDKTAPFEIPVGYFRELPGNILAKLNSNTGAKVIKMPVMVGVLKYAAAAIFTGVIALGVYKFTGKTVKQDSSFVKLDPSIERGKTMTDKAFSESLDNLSEEAIVKYLEKNGNETDVSVLTSNIENTMLPEQEDYLLDENTLDNFLKDLKNNSN